MKKNMVWILLAVVAAFLVWGYFYEHQKADAENGGAVVSNDGGSKTRMDQGAVDIDGKSSSDVDSNGQYTSASSAPAAKPVSPVANPGAPPSQATVPATTTTTSSTTSPSSNYKTVGATTGPDTNLPSGDTLTANAPNGMAFGGSGKFQWYRQGNLTWRINTQSGTSCVAFATMDEWAKPIVYSHGCGNA